MIAELAPLFTGEFAHYRDIMALPDDPRPAIPATDVVTPDGLEARLMAYAPDCADGDRRALVSQWSRTYFLRLTVPTVAASLVLGWRLPVAFETLQIIIGDDGLPEGFKLPHAGERWNATPDGPFERFSDLLDGNFTPFIEGVVGQVKVSRKVLWSNAGNYFEWLVSMMAKVPLPAAMIEDGQALIETALRPDGSRNPMYQPVRYVERQSGPSPLRQRRHCCVRYLLPELALCENCPHIDRPPAGARLPETV
ncbi:MAG: siderophore-iron reductase FhuF [Alteromonadaceae bacterium]|nr:siderophore-iron reductase FhuF [Alteromonadaceae bacterium]MBH84606.1 siderophore-iron reductase FhuF [Alteromonadaceae bacterium]|tara:strand:- start:40129 stop:40884 length:756 start_codon:yes stop_codon:yes gene_type:complete